MRTGLLFSLVVSGLSAFAVAAQADDHVRVGTPEGTAYVFAPIDVGNGAGIFAKHGLTVEKLNFAGGGKIGEAMSANAVDVTVSGNTDLAFIAKGEPAKAVAVAAGAPVEMAIIVRSDGSIAKPADLKGKTIGVTSPTSLTSWLALAFSRDNGWGADGIKRAYIGSMTSEVAGLLTKNVDAIVGPVEGAYLLQEKGQGQVLMTFGDMKVFITHIIYAHDNFIKDHPDALRRFLAGWFETIAYMKANKAETLRLTEPVTKLSPAIADKVYALETPALTDHGRFDEKAMAATMQSFLDVGVLDKLPDNPKALYTEEFLPK
ncbi:MAG TPA: ABC transporter substrate-binding protein [Stellaceae bacterium]|jgi:ABC-type nitrate/sulfonate/bicarbonate transport system substrate-binding protein|nr:ABC transporter substrate-binding protein [Stellaceae bacterium]